MNEAIRVEDKEKRWGQPSKYFDLSRVIPVTGGDYYENERNGILF